MNKTEAAFLNAAQYLSAYGQTESLLQIISLILSIITTFVLGITAIANLISKAKQDGKIDSTELKEISDQTIETINNVAEQIENFKENRENKNHE